MILKSFLPGPQVREYVRNFGIVHLVFSKEEAIPVKAYTPKPGDSIEFFLRDPEFFQYPGEAGKTKRPAVFINGQQTKVINRYIGREFLYFNISFQPGAFFRLTGIPLTELTNTFVEADAIFSKDIRLIREQLSNARSYPEMLQRAEAFILMLINRSKKDQHHIDLMARLMLQDTDRLSMDRLARLAFLSPRQFERKFNERMGVAPTLLARLARFDRAFVMKNAQPHKDWLSVAVQCGYYDYQHMVKDYKEFTGLAPTGFFDLDNEAPERIFGLHE